MVLNFDTKLNAYDVPLPLKQNKTKQKGTIILINTLLHIDPFTFEIQSIFIHIFLLTSLSLERNVSVAGTEL